MKREPRNGHQAAGVDRQASAIGPMYGLLDQLLVRDINPCKKAGLLTATGVSPLERLGHRSEPRRLSAAFSTCAYRLPLVRLSSPARRPTTRRPSPPR